MLQTQIRFTILPVLFAAVTLCNALTLTKTGTGFIYGDDFNGTALDTSIWDTWDHAGTGIGVSFEEGWLVVSGTPTPQANYHIGVMAVKTPLKSEPRNAVMAGKLKIPGWTDVCTPLTPPYDFNDNRIEFHFCNRTPDINYSIWMRRNCRNSYETDTVPHIYGYYPNPDHVRNGIGIFISYKDRTAKGFIADGSATELISGPDATNLDNNKMMELKAYDLYPGVALDYRYDWACVYLQPLDYPVVFHLADGLADGRTYTVKLSHSDLVSQGTGTASINVFLPEDKMYPTGALVEVFDSHQQLLGQTTINGNGQLDGLFPGDTFTISSFSTVGSELPVQASLYENIVAAPNPFKSIVSINVNLKDLMNHPVAAIYNLQGRLVEQVVFPAGGTVRQMSWNAEGFPAGIYVLKLKMGNNIFSRKLYLQK